MPATVTYILIAPDTAIPIRVFVNRSKIFLQNSVAVNEKSVIELTSINLIRLSNYDLNNLIDDIGGDLRQILLQTPLQDLFPKRAVQKTTKLVRDIACSWHCKVTVSLGYIVGLRYNLGSLQLAEDIQYLSERKVAVNVSSSAKSALIKKEISISSMFPEDESAIGLDDTKSVNYKLRHQTLLNNDIVDTLDVYVVHRPKI